MYWNRRVQQGETAGEIAKWKDTFMVIQCVEQVQHMRQRYRAIASRKYHEDHGMHFNPCATHSIWSYVAHQEEEKLSISKSRMGTHPSKVQGKWEHK